MEERHRDAHAHPVGVPGVPRQTRAAARRRGDAVNARAESAAKAPQAAAHSAPPGTWRIFRAFLRLGLTAFGGPAIIAIIRDMAVTRNNWLAERTFREGLTLCQSLPGATAMQMGAYVGLKAGGLRGAVAAYVGLGLPAFLMMLGLAATYGATRSLESFQALFQGLQIVVMAILAVACAGFGRALLGTPRHWLLAGLACALLAYGVNPFGIIVASALAGMIVFRNSPVAASPQACDTPAPSHVKPMLAYCAALLAGLGLLSFLDGKLFSLTELMLRINVVAFNGGFSSLPLMLHEIVDVRGWMDAKTFMDGIALGQVTPGPISITSTFLGYMLFGLPGAVAATVAMFSPSFVLLMLADPYHERLKASVRFQRASMGVNCCFVGLLAYTAGMFALATHWSPVHVLLGAAAVAALALKVDMLVVVIGGGIAALLLF
nr:chromate efflux transporter [Fundidesulfovibrio agrisoli]